MKRPHPIQPLEVVDGVLRYKQNRIVRALLNNSQARGFGLNELALQAFSAEDWEQFDQLTGYSHSAAPHVTEGVSQAAYFQHSAGVTEQEARYQTLLDLVQELLPRLRTMAALAFHKCEEDLCSEYDPS